MGADAFRVCQGGSDAAVPVAVVLMDDNFVGAMGFADFFRWARLSEATVSIAPASGDFCLGRLASLEELYRWPDGLQDP